MEAKEELRYDGNYHCAYCGKVFRIAERVEFIEHQKTCHSKPEGEIKESK